MVSSSDLWVKEGGLRLWGQQGRRQVSLQNKPLKRANMDRKRIRGTWLTQATGNGIQDKGGHGIRRDTETGRDTDGARRIRTRDAGTGRGATGLNGLTAQLSASYPD